MNDDLREKVHFSLQDTYPEDYFLEKYLELDPNFKNILDTEFGIEM